MFTEALKWKHSIDGQKYIKKLLTILMFIDQKKLRARSKIALEEGMNKFAYFLLKLIKHFLF